MSIALLQDPEKLHDLLDDLESVFWVMVCCALEWFLRPNQTRPMSMFEEEKVDEEGRTIGGDGKYVALWSGSLKLKTFTCPSLQRLVYDCAQRWGEFHLARQDDPSIAKLGSEGMMEKLKEMLDLAPQPVFWQRIFTSALESASSCCIYQQSSVPSETGQPHHTKPTPMDNQIKGKKRSRAALNDGSPRGDESQQLRRSKRIRLQ